MFDIENRRYVGNKYKLMNWIREIILENCPNCTSFFDVFAGTGSVSGYLINDFEQFILNDFLFSNEVIYKGFFGTSPFSSSVLLKAKEKYNNLIKSEIGSNYISENFGDKFFSMEDASKIGFIREDIERLKSSGGINEKEYCILLSSLLFSTDRVANTCGHYDAYIRSKKIRSAFNYELINPFNTDNKNISIYRCDANDLAQNITADIAFIDPPYNSRQYSRFYHVLETITKWEKPELYGTALKPKKENMSDYCKVKAPQAFFDLVGKLNVKYIVVTYNNTYNSKSSSSKNKITLEQIKTILDNKGTTKTYEKAHKFFNAGKTDLPDHKEYLFVTRVG